MPTIDPKRIAAEKAVEFVQDGMIIGLGTGSTAYWAIQKIGERVKQGLKIQAVASSEQSTNLAAELHIPIISFDRIQQINLTIDGADEVDKNKNLIKGGGGALLREKIIASNSERFIVVVDASKMVEHLGAFPLPVEIIPFASNLILQNINALGSKASVRMEKGRPYVTDNGNHIADCQFSAIKEPAAVNQQLHMIPGVVETGLFVDLKPRVIVGHPDGKIEVL